MRRRPSPPAAAVATAAPGLAIPVVIALCFVALLPTPLTGCGDDAGDLRTYRNDRYGFSLTFEEHYVDWKEADVGDQGVFGVAFADPDGARAGDRYVDAILVAVIDLGEGATPEVAEQTREALRDRGAETIATLGDDVRTWPVTDVTINGLSGIVIPFAVTVQGTQVLGWEYMLVKDSSLYVIVVMAGESSWEGDKEALQAAAQSFTVE